MELTSRILGLQIAFHREVVVALKAFLLSINYALAQTQPRQESEEYPDIPHVAYSNMSHISISPTWLPELCSQSESKCEYSPAQ